ncbi:FAD-binding oxidoreductase [Liquorilactobacillus mali]|nr:FAD-dependent oxidoreductase [Liquorilactobacillus mali]EJF01632.1 FAD/FMN-containing dehydrogenase [Liquorilactobacillus mali KCTC 3596 = DSM 20444]QFQ74407.1 FAD-dependent oxidoreductase [Liquorilactobacillus mali]
MEIKQNNNWPELPNSLKNLAIFPSDPTYKQVRSNYFRVGTPLLIIMAKTETNIVDTIKYVSEVRRQKNWKITFSVRSGGHGITMTSVNDGGIILDISSLNKVEIIDANKGIAKIQAGAVWGDVAQKLSPYNLVISSGDFGDTGVGGLTVYGGIGLLVRRFGLTIDHLIGARIVTAIGKIIVADKTHYPELFWAIRGGGSQIGIVTEFLFKADKLIDKTKSIKTPICLQTVTYSVNNLSDFIHDWQEWISSAPKNLTSLLMITNSNHHVGNFSVQATNIWAGIKDENEHIWFNQASKLAGVVKHQEKVMNYADMVVAPHTPHTGQQAVYVKNTLVRAFTPQIAKEITNILNNFNSLGIELRYIGGALNTINAMTTAWTCRNAVGFIALWSAKDDAAQANKNFEPLLKLGTGVYGAYSSDLSSEENARVWPEYIASKLKAIADKEDPDKLFNQGRNI